MFQSALFVLIFFLSYVCAQSLPPAKADGFVYGGHLLDSDVILIEAFFDPVCPDSRDGWPPLKQVLQNYGHSVQLVVHLLPLPSVSLFISISSLIFLSFCLGEFVKWKNNCYWLETVSDTVSISLWFYWREFGIFCRIRIHVY